jgi:prepilin-type processing-associated H-X9-DG protein
VTLVELLVSIAVIAVLVAVLLPALQSSREAARRVQCGNHLHQIGLALCAHETTQRAFPVGCIECDYRLPSPRRQIAWTVSLLPYLELQAVADRFHWDQPFHSLANQPAGGTPIQVFLCPSTVTTRRQGPTTGDRNGNGRWDPRDDLAYTDYGGLFGVSFPVPEILPEHQGVLVYEQAITVTQIPDGLSKTAAVGECTGRGAEHQSEWANGHNIFDQTYDKGINVSQDNELWSDHPSGVQLVFCDGHVAFISETVDQAVLLAFLTRQGRDTTHPP